MLKFKNEWPLLLETARANRLDREETILLFAIREVEAGESRNEFNKENVQNTSLAIQADSMASQIQKGEFIYQKYCLGKFSPLPLSPMERPMPFVEFLGQVLMPNEGVRKDTLWIMRVSNYIKEIEKEFETKTGGSNDNARLN